MGNPLELWYHTAMVLYDRCDMFTVNSNGFVSCQRKSGVATQLRIGNEGVGVTSSVNPFPFKQFKKFGDFCGIPIRVSVTVPVH